MTVETAAQAAVGVGVGDAPGEGVAVGDGVGVGVGSEPGFPPGGVPLEGMRLLEPLELEDVFPLSSGGCAAHPKMFSEMSDAKKYFNLVSDFVSK